ncbi:MAG: DMT family transporter [Chloroflexota bacterium]
MKRNLPYIAAVTAVIIWGGTFVAARIGLNELTPFQLATARFVTATAVFLPILIVLLIKGQRLALRDLPTVALLAFLGITTYFYIQFAGVGLTGPSNSSVLVSLSPVWVALFGHFFLGERLNARALLGIVVGCAGAAIVATHGRFGFGTSRNDLIGSGLILVNTLEWATYTVVGRRVVSRYQPLFLTACIAVTGTAMLIPLSLVLGAFPSSWRFAPATWGAVIYLGAISSVLCYSVWYFALKHLEASRVAVFQYFQPLVSIIVAWALLHEQPTLSLIVGGAAIIAGVAIVTANRARGGQRQV